MDNAAQWREDADFFGLTWYERVRFYARISEYYGRKVAYHGEKAERYGRWAGRWIVASTILWAISLVLLLIGQVR